MKYHYCPKCSSLLALVDYHDEKVLRCTNQNCQFIFWQNSKPCTSVIILNDKHEVLMAVRAIEPSKGKLDLPGGFLKEDENPYVGAKREIKEELGVEIEIIDLVGFVIDQYCNQDQTEGDFTLNIGLLAKIIHGKPKPADDITAIEWVDPNHFDQSRLAFANNLKFLELIKKRGIKTSSI